VADRAGTLERLALELGSALRRVGALLGPDEVLHTFAEFGVAFPPELLTHPGFSSAQQTTVAAAGALSSDMEQLVAAIEAEDVGQIAASGVQLIEAARGVIASFNDLTAQLQAAGHTLPGVTPAQIAELTTDFPRKLLDFAVVEGLDTVPAVGATLTVFGLVERTFHPADPANPASVGFETSRLRLDRLGRALTAPAQHFSDLYQWGDPGFDGQALLQAVTDIVARLGLPARYQPPAGGQPARAEAFALDLTVAPGNPPGLAVDLMLPIQAAANHVFQLPVAGWSVLVTAAASASVGTSGTIAPPLAITLRPPAGTIEGTAELTVQGRPASPFVLVGAAGGSRLEIAEIDAGLGLDIAWDTTAGHAQIAPRAEAQIKGGRLVVDTSSGDGFIAQLVSGLSVDAHFETGVSWSAATGVRFVGSSTLEIALPVHISLGPIDLPTLYIALGIEADGFPLELSADINATLGPVQAVVNRLGVRAVLSFPAGGGNLGPAELEIGFKPPNGVGLAVNAGVVTGGGFLYFDPQAGEYAGALELEFADFLALKAIGLITTRMPDGTPGFSLLLVITAEFPGGLQLGYGFKLIGVGGLIGVNRGMRLEAIMEGVRTGAIESVMFPHDVVANAPRILSDLKAFFPPQDGIFLIGPMAKLGWGTPTLVSASLGVIIEIPGNIAILGVLKVALPTEDEAILLLQVNFAGAIEFDKKRIYFFAALFDSRVLTITIEGELGLLVAYGEQPDFVLSVGGFHPAFKPPPLPFPVPKRISLNLLNTDVAHVSVDGYFAVTSNTAQFGAHAQLFFGFSAISVEAHLGFDALFQFSPFKFVIAISAGASVKVFGVGLFSVDLDLTLSGPTPWEAKGTASISILFFSIDVDFDVTWGEERDTTLPPVDVLPLLAAELTKAESWRTRAPAGGAPLVNLRALAPAEADIVLHPLGTLFVQQRAVPLDIRIDKVGSERAADVNQCQVAVGDDGLVKVSDAVDMFAVAQFQNLSDAQKLSLPSFEREHAGVELAPDGAAMASTRAVRRSARYEEIVIDSIGRQANSLVTYNAALFEHFLAGSSVARSPLAQAERTLRQPFSDRITVPGDTYVVASVRDNSADGPIFSSHAQARAHLDALLAEDPNRTDALHVIPAMEAAA
jgi:hypothetical protein